MKELNKAEMENGIGEEINLDEIEVEDDFENDFMCLAHDEENEMDDDELIAEYHKCKAECEHHDH